jgi:hypothetical protein
MANSDLSSPPADIDWQHLSSSSFWPEHEMGISHNPSCGAASTSCSVRMSNIPNLCFWHSRRMAELHTHECGCGRSNTLMCGDAVGRSLARGYYGEVAEKAGVSSAFGIYCCINCHCADSEEYMCGEMRVCGSCAKLHKESSLQKIQKDDPEADD